jgi:GDYXXLXY protein
MTPREILRVAGLALPVVGIAVGIVRAELQLAHAQRFVLPITGYDPRDLLHGHYLAYRLVLGEGGDTSVCADEAPGCALCLSAGVGYAPSSVRRVPGAGAAEGCDALVPISALPSLQRFYIPEARADELTVKLRDAAAAGEARLVVAVDRAGTARATALWLAGEVVDPAD